MSEQTGFHKTSDSPQTGAIVLSAAMRPAKLVAAAWKRARRGSTIGGDLISGVAIVAVAFVGLTTTVDATAALFNDSEAIGGNSFTAGTMDLKLTDSDETDQESLSTSWTYSGMKPGESVSATITTKNVGNLAADHIEVATANSVGESASAPGNTNTTPMDTVLEITVFQYDGVDKLMTISDVNANGIRDLDDLETAPADNLALADLNLAHTIDITVRLNTDLTTNQHHGDSVTTVLTVTLNQDSSQ